MSLNTIPLTARCKRAVDAPSTAGAHGTSCHGCLGTNALASVSKIGGGFAEDGAWIPQKKQLRVRGILKQAG